MAGRKRPLRRRAKQSEPSPRSRQVEAKQLLCVIFKQAAQLSTSLSTGLIATGYIKNFPSYRRRRKKKKKKKEAGLLSQCRAICMICAHDLFFFLSPRVINSWNSTTPSTTNLQNDTMYHTPSPYSSRSAFQSPPPPPPPKPNSHEASRRSTPKVAAQSFPDPPKVEEEWLPEVVKDKSYVPAIPSVLLLTSILTFMI